MGNRDKKVQNNVIGKGIDMKKAGLFMLMIASVAFEARADMYAELKDVYESNPVILQGRAAVDAAHSELSLARTGYKPYLGVSANAGAARTKIASQTFDYNPTQIGVEFQQNIFQGFGTIAQIKAAKGMLASQQALLYATQQDVFLQAINAYINVLNTDEILKLNKNNQRVLQEYYDLCVDRQRVGTLTKTDVAQASARLEMAKYRVTDAQADYDNSIETFRRIYGTVPDSFQDISLDRVEHLFPASVSDAQEYALAHHPALSALAAQEAAAKEDITVARKSMLPAIDVRASAMQINDLPYIDKVRDSRVGVYLKVPLFDRGTAFANTDKVRFTVDGIVQQTINARRTIVENLNQAWNMYDAQTAAITAANAGARAAQMALDGTRAEQKHGRRTVLDVLNAEQELLNAKVSLATATHAQTSAYFTILAATGQLSAQNLGIAPADDTDDR